MISNTCGGYSFYKDAKLLRLTRYRYNIMCRCDSNGHYFYIKDGDTVWNPGWQPTKTELDSYECRHGTRLQPFLLFKKRTESRGFLPLFPMDDNCEVNRADADQ